MPLQSVPVQTAKMQWFDKIAGTVTDVYGQIKSGSSANVQPVASFNTDSSFETVLVIAVVIIGVILAVKLTRG